MRRWILLLVAAAILPAASGCAFSSMVMESGKHYDHLLNEGVTRGEIHADLGPPIARYVYDQPVPIKQIPDAMPVILDIVKKNINGTTILFVDEPHELNFNPRAVSCEIFHRKGPFHHHRGMETVHNSWMALYTLGISELWYLPKAIVDRIRRSKDDFYLTFWYDADDNYIGWFFGDVRKGRNPD